MGINFADVHMRMGLYPGAPRTPFVPGYEASGVVSEAGPGVRSFQPGDRVLAVSRFGAYTTQIVLPAYQVRAVPAHLSDLEAAGVPVAFMAAWIAARIASPGRARPSASSSERRGPQSGQQVACAWNRRSDGSRYSVRQRSHRGKSTIAVFSRSNGVRSTMEYRGPHWVQLMKG
jgi:hypothetical protein